MNQKVKRSGINIILGIVIGFIYYFSLRLEFLYKWMNYLPQQFIFLGNILPVIVVSILLACIIGKNVKDRIVNALQISIISVLSTLIIVIVVGSNIMYNFDR